MPDDGLCNQNMWHWMTFMEVLCLPVILHVYSL